MLFEIAIKMFLRSLLIEQEGKVKICGHFITLISFKLSKYILYLIKLKMH